MRWSDNELTILKDNYGKVKIETLEELLSNRTRQAIQKIAQKHKLKGDFRLAQRKYTYDTQFFITPNIQNSYWAGYIAADGCVDDEHNLSFGIAYKDIELLQNFQQQTKHTSPIRLFKLQEYNYARFNAYGVIEWCSDLQKHWNITPRKSNTLQPPNLVTNECIYAYIIGYFDGDGSIFTSNKRLWVAFCGTEQLMIWIREHICRLCDVRYAKISQNGISVTNKQMKWSGKDAIRIYDNLQQIVNISWRLKRKWQQK